MSAKQLGPSAGMRNQILYGGVTSQFPIDHCQHHSNPPSLRVQFLHPMLPPDLDFALIFSGLCEIISKLHP